MAALKMRLPPITGRWAALRICCPHPRSGRPDPRRTKPGEINHLHGGRGVYFDDPNGHVMEIITHPYGDRPEQI